MNTKSTPDAKEMFHVNGNSNTDNIAVSEFCKWILKEAKERYDNIHDYKNMRKIMSSEGENIIRDSIFGLNHIYKTVAALNKFHEKGKLAEIFNNLASEINKINMDSKNAVDELYQMLNT